MANHRRRHHHYLVILLTVNLWLTDKAEADRINSSIDQIDARWRKLSVEIGSVETILHEALQHWMKYKSNKDLLLTYMQEAEKALDAPIPKQMVNRFYKIGQ